MHIKKNFLESDSSILENNLKFVKNELEDQLGSNWDYQNVKRDSKVILPLPGMCIKCFKSNTREKFFINLCQTDAMPAPKDISEEVLTEILNSDIPGSYRIPMSISEPRLVTDKSGKKTDCCDIVVNENFFLKCETNLLFRDFLIALVLEAISEKYNIQASNDDWIVLKNRKCIGTLVQHRIQNRDVQNVHNAQGTTVKNNQNGPRKLIEVINTNELTNKDLTKNIKEPMYKLRGKMENEKIVELLAEFFLPDCINADDIALNVGEDRIMLTVKKHGYFFDKFIEPKISQDPTVEATFDSITRMLQLNLPIMSASS